MSSIEEITAQIETAIGLADEAWDFASQAKEKAQDARMALAALTRETTPELLGEAIGLLDRAYEAFEDGQTQCTVSQSRARDYVDLVSG